MVPRRSHPNQPAIGDSPWSSESAFSPGGSEHSERCKNWGVPYANHAVLMSDDGYVLRDALKDRKVYPNIYIYIDIHVINIIYSNES